MYYHFEFKSGCNPYIAFNEKTAEKTMRLFRKNGWTVEEIIKGFFLVHDEKEKRDLF